MSAGDGLVAVTYTQARGARKEGETVRMNPASASYVVGEGLARYVEADRDEATTVTAPDGTVTEITDPDVLAAINAAQRGGGEGDPSDEAPKEPPTEDVAPVADAPKTRRGK